jgi:hypothetical protein
MQYLQQGMRWSSWNRFYVIQRYLGYVRTICWTAFKYTRGTCVLHIWQGHLNAACPFAVHALKSCRKKFTAPIILKLRIRRRLLESFTLRPLYPRREPMCSLSVRLSTFFHLVWTHTNFRYALFCWLCAVLRSSFVRGILVTFTARSGYSAIQYGRRVFQMVQSNVGLACTTTFLLCTTRQ